MAADFVTHRIEDIAFEMGDAPFGSNLKNSDYTDSGALVVQGKNIQGRSFDWSDKRHVSKDKWESLARSHCHVGDIIFPKVGTIGKVGILSPCKGYEHYVLSTNTMRLRVDPAVADNLYVYYFFTWSRTVNLIHALNSKSVQPVFNFTTLKNFEIKLPPLKEQKAIAHILGSLDDKIELNRQMNETLEAMAQALFKSWFVDFDPVIDNALAAGNEIPEPLQERAAARQALGDQRKPLPPEIQSQFPSCFVFTDEMGWIPEGWNTVPFGELIEKTIGGDWGKDEPDDKHQRKVAIIRGTDIPSVKQGSPGSTPTRWVEDKKFLSRELQDGDIVIEVSGGSPKQPTGRAVYITHSNISLLGGDCVPASFCRKFRPKTKFLGLYAGLHLDSIYALGKMWGYQNQSTGISNFQTNTFLEVEKVVLPPNQALLAAFFERVRPLIDKSRTSQNEALAQVRDTLLPKLLSGELRVNEAQQQLAEAL